MALGAANRLYFGDCLDVMREDIPDDSVDLIYLDPPFNSKRLYNAFMGGAQWVAFEDTWRWYEAVDDFHEVARQPAYKGVMEGLRLILGESSLLAYLSYMANRLLECHRVLKPTGSIYLHYDPTASHYLKLIMDAVFGQHHYLNEIVWKRTGAHNSAKRCGPIHDILLAYSKGASYVWNQQYQAQDEYIRTRYTYRDDDGRQFYPVSLIAAGTRNGSSGETWQGIDVTSKGNHWRYGVERLNQLTEKWLRKSEQGDKWNRCLIEGMIVLSETGARDEQTTPP